MEGSANCGSGTVGAAKRCSCHIFSLAHGAHGGAWASRFLHWKRLCRAAGWEVTWEPLGMSRRRSREGPERLTLTLSHL